VADFSAAILAGLALGCAAVTDWSRSHGRPIRIPCAARASGTPHYRHPRHDRRLQSIRLTVEALERRILRAGTSPTNPVPVSPKPIGSPTPQQLGAAYLQVEAIQTTALHALDAAAREVEDAGAQLASQGAAAINGLTAELDHSASDPGRERALAAAIHRDRHLLNLGAAHAARFEQTLEVARGVEAQSAYSDQTDIPNDLFTSLQQLVGQTTMLGASLACQGQEQAVAVIAKLNLLSGRLAKPTPGGT
jgi:hypothetical protein